MENTGVIIDRILDYLRDNRLGEFRVLTKLSGLGREKLSVVLDFLERFGFVAVDLMRDRVRLTDASMKLVNLDLEFLEEVHPPLKQVP